MKANQKTKLAAAVLAVAAALMLGLWYFNRPQARAGAETVADVAPRHGASKEFSYNTPAEYLGELLVDEGLAQGEQGAYGLFITTVDGETAQDSLRQWWCITKGGERVDTGADATPIADGDHFELTLSTY